MTRIVITGKRPNSRFWSAHTHSRFSANDALSSVADLVKEAKRLGYPGLGLTDHGNMSGAVQLYMECKKAGIKPFIGSEMYLVRDRSDKKAKRYHLGLLAYTTQGYRNMVQISTRSHQQFHHKPLIDLADLAMFREQGLTEGIALLTGCFYGLVIQTAISDGWDAAKQLVAFYAMQFPATYVEIQRHNIDQEGMTEAEISEGLMYIAYELGLPVIVTQDSHYTVPEEREHHDSLKRLVAFGPDQDDAVFPGDGFHMADDRWMADHHDETVLEAGLTGLDQLLADWDMAIPEMDSYDYRVPAVAADPHSEISRRCTRELLRRGLGKKRYLDQLAEELGVIDAARMSDYMLLTTMICDHMREVGMFYQVRGSAAGSLVCWLLKISNLDPIKWKLRFDRFLSKDRTKPPDIDIDVEHERRQELIAWISSRFTVLQIATFGTYSISGDEETGKGSLRVLYLARKKAMGEDAIWRNVSQEDLRKMEVLSGMNLVSSYGTHAAGLILCSTRTELETQVPIMYVASSKTYLSQYGGKDVEKIGLVKLDVLGVKTLSVLRRAMQNMGRDVNEGFDWIPLTDSKVYSRVSQGDTAGVYQLEGWTNTREIRRLKPTKIGDLIAAMALYRPGVTKSGAAEAYLRRRDKQEETPKRHPIIEQATGFSHGILLYQDQVIEVIRALGMNSDQVTEFLGAVKASNKNIVAAAATMTRYEPIVQRMCLDAGMDDADIAWLWDALKAFADYSFNRAHATVYGLTAYHCAWLILHYPLEFHAALLAVAAGDKKKERPYLQITRNRGIRIMKADVNLSKATYSVDPKRRGIRKGLMGIHGIGKVVALEIEKNQPFKDLDDFAERCNPSKVSGLNDYNQTKSLKADEVIGKLSILLEAGALESVGG